MASNAVRKLDKVHQYAGLIRTSQVRVGVAYDAAIRLVGEKREDTGARFAPLGDVMGVEARRIATIRDGMKVEAEGGGVRQEQGRQMGEPCCQQAMLMFPLYAVGVVGGKGRLGEKIESRKEPECLIEIEV